MNDPEFDGTFDDAYIAEMKCVGTHATQLEAWALAKEYELMMLLVVDGQKIIHDYGRNKVILTFLFGTWNMGKNFIEEVEEVQ